MSTLDQLQEIIHAYENTHNILLCGDMNSSLLKRHGNPQDQMLHDFVLQEGVNGVPLKSVISTITLCMPRIDI